MSNSNNDQIKRFSLGWICETVILVCATLMFIGAYLISGSSPELLPLMYLAGGAIVIAFVGRVYACHRTVERATSKAEKTKFRIDYQLVETLKALQAPTDVVYGLQVRCHSGARRDFDGETDFLNGLNSILGEARTEEVRAMVLRYATAKIDPERETVQEKR